MKLIGSVLLSLFAFGANASEAREAWYDFNFHGKKVGFLFALDEETTLEGQAVTHSRRRSVVTVKRQDHVIRMEATTDAWADPTGRPIRFTNARVESGATRTIEGQREGKSFVIRFIADGNVSERKVPLEPDMFLASSLDVHFKRSLAMGKTLKGRVIQEEDGEVRPFSLEVIRALDGGRFELKSTVDQIVSVEIVRKDGTTEKTSVARLGAEFVLTDRDTALKLEKTEDIFSAARLLSNLKLPPGDRIDALTVRFTGRSGRRPTTIADERQRAKNLGPATVELAVKTDPPPVRAAKLPIKSTAKLARFLKPTEYEALSDARIATKAKDLARGGKDAWELAQAINTFVHGHIQNKSLAHAFSTATEAFTAREGDCTEHAVLFSALAKAAGLPTKLITGLVYVGGRESIFGFHQWVEVWVGDRWVAMDPTFGQDLADPTHIKFAEGVSDPDGLREAGIVAAELFGDLDLEVVEYTSVDGKTHRP